MRRSLGLDVLDCPRCGHRMELIAAIEDPAVARRILEHLGLSTRAPPRGRPWRPRAQLDRAPPASYAEGLDPPAFDN